MPCRIDPGYGLDLGLRPATEGPTPAERGAERSHPAAARAASVASNGRPAALASGSRAPSAKAIAAVEDMEPELDQECADEHGSATSPPQAGGPARPALPNIDNFS